VRPDGDDQVAAGQRRVAAVAQRNVYTTFTGDPRRPTHDLHAGVGQPLHVATVVGPIAVDAIDVVVAELRRAGPRVVAAERVNPGRVEQRFRRDARPERARSTDQLALDNGDAGAQPARLESRRFARGAGTDDHEVVAPGHGGKLQLRSRVGRSSAAARVYFGPVIWPPRNVGDPHVSLCGGARANGGTQPQPERRART
jgi:hypothetical protein